jgi:hypothetical protein
MIEDDSPSEAVEAIAAPHDSTEVAETQPAAEGEMEEDKYEVINIASTEIIDSVRNCWAIWAPILMPEHVLVYTCLDTGVTLRRG